MKTNRFFLGLFVGVAMCACSSDEVGITPDNPKVFTGDEAYINVRLADASALSRATTDGGYEYGTADEHDVKNAYFYFYDADGLFVAQGSAWNGEGSTGSDTPAGNIEFNSNNVVVLKGLEKKNYPKYMVTVLNGTSNFDYGTTLDEMEKKLAGGIYTGIAGSDGKTKGYFIMSTTSFAGQTNEAGQQPMKYFVTEVKDEHFSLEPIEDNTTAKYVTVYVERLAAKVTLDVDDTELTYITVGNEKLYEIKATVAGDFNDEDASAGNNDQMATESLYVKFLGWKLNATAKDSYLLKNIDESWTDTKLGFPWNAPNSFRSFWGKSYNYGLAGYPTDASGAASSEYLDYTNLTENLIAFGGSAYCAENTNSATIVNANFPSAVTSVLLKAQICDKDGNPLSDLVRFNGVLFKKSSFVDYVINVLNMKGAWNVWVKKDATTYKQLDAEYLEVVGNGDGKVKIQLTASAPALYKQTTTDSGSSFTELTAEEKSTVYTNLLNECNTGSAIGYKGGLMYYNIPIEHLNNNKTENSILEARYGVVRNHHYVVTINKLDRVGKGIFNESEVIVPDGGTEKDSYFVGANIAILSWRIVNQSVKL